MLMAKIYSRFLVLKCQDSGTILIIVIQFSFVYICVNIFLIRTFVHNIFHKNDIMRLG